MRGSPEMRFWAKVNKHGPNGCWVWVGGGSVKGYGMLRIAYKNVSTHRFAYALLVGPIPKGMELDHVCNNRSCVNPSHLRPCSRLENTKNRILNANNLSGFKGVSRAGEKWQAEIQANKKRIYLGVFPTPELAHAAYCHAAIQLHGEFANNGERL